MKLTELKKIGINNADELEEAGSKDVFIRMKCAYPEVCLISNGRY